MNSLQNSVSRKPSISASSSSIGKLQSSMKPKGPLTTMIASTAILSQSIASIQTVAGHQRIGRRILGHLHKKETQEPSIKDLLSTIKEAAAAEAHTHSDLCTSYSTVVKPTITQKVTLYSSSPKEKWTKQSNQPSQQMAPREVNHTMQWATHRQQYSPYYP
jgi:hypothetical protein